MGFVQYAWQWLYATGDDIFASCYGKFDTGYKEEIPVTMARAVIQATARELLDLLFDNNNAKINSYTIKKLNPGIKV